MLSGTNKNIFSVFSFRQFYPNTALNFDKIMDLRQMTKRNPAK